MRDKMDSERAIATLRITFLWKAGPHQRLSSPWASERITPRLSWVEGAGAGAPATIAGDSMVDMNGATVTRLCQVSRGQVHQHKGQTDLGSVAGAGSGASLFDACSENKMGEEDTWRATSSMSSTEFQTVSAQTHTKTYEYKHQSLDTLQLNVPFHFVFGWTASASPGATIANLRRLHLLLWCECLTARIFESGRI